MKIIIVGGGITGLAAANRLRELKEENNIDIDFKIIESSNRLGGNISTLNHDNLLIEEGPDSFITAKPYALSLCKRLNIENELIHTSQSNRNTLVYLNGNLTPIPEGFILLSPTKIMPFITSPILSIYGRIRALLEIFIPKSKNVGDESLQSFVTRRFGKELFENMAQPLMGGIYTSDPRRLSIKAAVPNIYNLESKYGSVIKGLMKENEKNEDSGARYSQFVTLKNGMQTLVDSITSNIPDVSIKKNHHGKQIKKMGNNLQIETENGQEFTADGIILAIPSYISAEILKPLDKEISKVLSKIEFASTAIIILVYKKEDIKNKINGFGFVVPSKEKLNIIACSFSSEKFEGRAPYDSVLMRCFVGGALNQVFLENDDQEIINVVKNELHLIMKISKEPYFTHIKRSPRSMPQYNVGHSEILSNIKDLLSKHENLELAGNSYEGVGLPDCINSGERAADNLVNQLKK